MSNDCLHTPQSPLSSETKSCVYSDHLLPSRKTLFDNNSTAFSFGEGRVSRNAKYNLKTSAKLLHNCAPRLNISTNVRKTNCNDPKDSNQKRNSVEVPHLPPNIHRIDGDWAVNSNASPTPTWKVPTFFDENIPNDLPSTNVIVKPAQTYISGKSVPNGADANTEAFGTRPIVKCLQINMNWPSIPKKPNHSSFKIGQRERPVALALPLIKRSPAADMLGGAEIRVNTQSIL